MPTALPTELQDSCVKLGGIRTHDPLVDKVAELILKLGAGSGERSRASTLAK